MTPAAAIALLLLVGGASAQVRYFGKELGPLAQLQHGVRGRVFAVDSRTLYLQDFHYDGQGPAAYFYVGTSAAPGAGAGASRLRDERGGAGPLRRYAGESVTLSLPDGKTLKDYRWFAVYCDEYSVNFGDVAISRSMEYPRPAKVAALRGVHGVSSDPVVVVDAQTLLVPNFSYDGEAPDAKFWVGRGDKPSPQGIRIPDENGKEAPLRKYDKKTIVLTLPGELTVFDIGHFAVWCEAFTVNFGHVSLPRAALANVPPSLKMLGVSPQSRNNALTGSSMAAPARARAHRPLVRLDATTYRPPARLRPGAGVLSAFDSPAARLPLHRRADSYTPPSQQLVSIQSSKELTYKEDGTLQEHQKEVRQQQQQNFNPQQQNFNPQQQNFNPQQPNFNPQQQPGLQHQQQLQQQQRGLQYQQQLQQRHPGLQHQQQLQQQQHEYQQLLLQQQLLQQRQRHIVQQQKLLNDQIYYNQQQSEPQNYQVQQAAQQDYYNQLQSERAYQQQLYEQQRRAYELQATQQREPFQYRLLPYAEGGRA